MKSIQVPNEKDGRASVLRVFFATPYPAFDAGGRRAAEIAQEALSQSGIAAAAAHEATASGPSVGLPRRRVARPSHEIDSEGRMALVGVPPELQIPPFMAAPLLLRRALERTHVDAALAVGATRLAGALPLGLGLGDAIRETVRGGME